MFSTFGAVLVSLSFPTLTTKDQNKNDLMLIDCFKDVKLRLHVGLTLQCLTELCVSALISLIKDKSVRGRQTFL